jgi:SulP family sulfate permease
MYVPMLAKCLKSYNRKQFVQDLVAGVVVGIVALPLAMAFAIASGVTPERGLYTAIVAGFIISALGGSRVQIGGPTGAFVVIVYDIVQRHGVDGLLVCTFLAGVMLVIMGLARLGSVIKFIPCPVITGFTSGIAVIIFSSQIKDLFGLTTGPLPGDVLGKWTAYFDARASVNWAAVGLSALCLAVIVYWPARLKRLPGSVVALVAATALTQLLGLPVETIGSRFGGIPAALPELHLPDVRLEQVRELIGPALAVALLAGIESLLSAVVADGMTGYRHKSNMELVAQGFANMASPLFGGIPATGAIARTATNIRNGATTPVAGIVHALTLLAIVVVLGRWASLVPMCCLASVLVVVAYNMSEWRTFRALLHAPRSDVAVLLTTFTLTVVFDLVLAVQVGVVLAAFLFMKRMADVTQVGRAHRKLTRHTSDADGDPDLDPTAVAHRKIPAGVQVYEVNGPFFFGAADKLRDVLNVVDRPPRVMILRMRHVPVIDATGLHALEAFEHNAARAGTVLILAGVQRQPLRALHRSHWGRRLDPRNLCTDIDAALARAREVLEGTGGPAAAPPPAAGARPRKAKRIGS